MKTLKKLKLAELNKVKMEKQELNKLRGGGCCICGCKNGSSNNGTANNAGSKYSPAGGAGNGAFA